MVRVSVIIPTIGRRSLFRTIDSILSQGELVHEVIVVCSTRLEFELPDDPKIIVVNASKEFNVSNARNVGLKKVALESSWVAFCDDDDIWLPGKLQNQIDYCLKNRLDGSYTGAVVNTGKSETTIRPRTEYNLNHAPLAQVYNSFFSRSGYLPFPSFCFHASLLPFASFDENYTEHEDLLFVQNLYIIGFEFGQLSTPLIQVSYDIQRSLKRLDLKQEILWVEKLFKLRFRWGLVYVFRILLLKLLLTYVLRRS
jgi:glycosyltransferase involved in cell wall biosynthesis